MDFPFKSKQFRSVVYAPLPPPPGGVGSINLLLRTTLDSPDIGFFTPIHKFHNPFPLPFVLNIVNLLLLVKAIFYSRIDAKILFFSSEGFSFIEKTLWSLTVLLFRRSPIIFLVSGLFPSAWARSFSIVRNCLTFFINRPSICLLSQSASWQLYYSSLFPRCNHKLAPATVDLSFFAKRHKPVLNCRKPKLTYVGWISIDKGIVDLLDALQIVKQYYPSVTLDLIGPSFGTQDFWKHEIKIRHLSSNVNLLGSLDDRESLLSHLIDSSLFVFPSHFEGLPVSLIEALSLGLPCVAANAGGCSDVLDNGRAGIVVDVSSPDQLALSIMKLLDSYELRCYYSSNAFNHFARSYTVSNFKSKFLDILL